MQQMSIRLGRVMADQHVAHGDNRGIVDYN